MNKLGILADAVILVLVIALFGIGVFYVLNPIFDSAGIEINIFTYAIEGASVFIGDLTQWIGCGLFGVNCP